ncbi:hypothetical protein V8E54_010858 [Elaphomyces granulatus]
MRKHRGLRLDDLLGTQDGGGTAKGPGLFIYTKGMLVTILFNISTPLGFVNGARPRPALSPTLTVSFSLSGAAFSDLPSSPALTGTSSFAPTPPVCVLFQRDVVRHQAFEAVDRDCIPVFASTFPVKVGNMWIRRHRVPMSPAFALTEYKNHLIPTTTYRTAVLDLSRLTYATGEDAAHSRHCSAYGQLSRLQVMDRLWLLEPVTLSDLRNRMHRELVTEDQRLQQLAAVTLQSETV